MATPLIEVRDLWKIHRLGTVEVQALRGVSLDVAEGEYVAIMGSSGSGKSTFMNLIGCLDQPTRGTYRLAGVDVASMTRDERAAIRNRRIGFVFQGFNLLPRYTALENVALPLVYANVPAAEQRRRARDILVRLGLERHLAHLPSQMSGGQQQRVAIARALVADPALLLADEPTGNLDTATSEEIMTVLDGLRRERRITIVLVTHEADVAAHAARVLTFRDGTVVSDERRAA